MKTDTLRHLYYNEEGFSHIKRAIRVAEFLSRDKDLPRKITTNRVEIHFKYTGQPITCYRCGSTEHVVQNCPQKARLRKTPSPPPPLDTATRDPPTSPPVETMDYTPSNTGETTTPTSYVAAATPSLFSDNQEIVEPTHTRPPSSLVKDDKPPVKKISVSEQNASFEKSFLQALKEHGPVRTKLIQQMDGNRFYTLRLQHIHGNLQDADPRAVSRFERHPQARRLCQAYDHL